VQESDLTTDKIYNTKKISLMLQCLPKKTLTIGNEKFADGFKLSKEQLLFYIVQTPMTLNVLNYWAKKTTSIHKHLKTVCIPVEYTGQSNTWNNGEIFMHPFFHSFHTSIRERFIFLKVETIL